MTEAMIFDALAALKVDITQLSEHPDNYNQGDVNLIAESLRANSQYKPIIFNKATGHVLAGNHTLRAARALGWTHVAAIGIDTDDVTARKILAVDNQSAKKSVYDDALLAELLQSIPDLEGTGFTDDDLDDLLAGLEEEVELPPAPTDAAYAETPEEHTERAAAVASQSTFAAQGVAEVILVMDIDAKEDMLRDLDAIAKHLDGITRAASAARAARIALAVLDAADTNPELARLIDMTAPAELPQ